MTVDAVLLKSGNTYDLQIGSDGDILTDDFFDTAILVSLFVERRASSSEVPASHQRRGWIGNESTPGIEMGSKLWLLEQSRLTRTLINSANSFVLNALQWLIDDGYALNIEVDTVIQEQSLVIEATIERPNSKTEHRFYDLWNNTGTS